MASTDNGGQTITFKYQQEGTAISFNKLLHKVLPTGVISGGTLIASSNTQVEITPLEMMISDGANVTIHVSTSTNAVVTASYQLPYIIARYNWQSVKENYVDFEAVSYTTLQSYNNAIILGKCEYEGNILNDFDYTRKTWTASHYQNDFLYKTSFLSVKTPSFNVSPHEPEQSGNYVLDVGEGKAVINGKVIEFLATETVTLNTTDKTSLLYFKSSNIGQTFSRHDLLVLVPDDTHEGYHFEYIMGNNANDVPLYPLYGLVLAEIEIPAGQAPSLILGSFIHNVYNNNYLTGCATVGKIVYDEREQQSLGYEHTLFL